MQPGFESEVGEELRDDVDVSDLSNRSADPRLIFPEQVAQSVAVDEIDRRCAVTSRFLFGVRVRLPVVMSSSLSPRPLTAPLKSRTAPAPTLPLYRLHWKNTLHLEFDTTVRDWRAGSNVVAT